MEEILSLIFNQLETRLSPIITPKNSVGFPCFMRENQTARSECGIAWSLFLTDDKEELQSNIDLV